MCNFPSISGMPPGAMPVRPRRVGRRPANAALLLGATDWISAPLSTFSALAIWSGATCTGALLPCFEEIDVLIGSKFSVVPGFVTKRRFCQVAAPPDLLHPRNTFLPLLYTR